MLYLRSLVRLWGWGVDPGSITPAIGYLSLSLSVGREGGRGQVALIDKKEREYEHDGE